MVKLWYSHGARFWIPLYSNSVYIMTWTWILVKINNKYIVCIFYTSAHRQWRLIGFIKAVSQNWPKYLAIRGSLVDNELKMFTDQSDLQLNNYLLSNIHNNSTLYCLDLIDSWGPLLNTKYQVFEGDRRKKIP